MTCRDWISVICGWIAAVAVIWYTGGLTGEPIDIQFAIRLALIFAAGFGTAWFVRLVVR